MPAFHPTPPQRSRRARRAWAVLLLVFTGCGPGGTDGEGAGPRSGSIAGHAGGCAEVAGETVTWIVPFTAGGGYDVVSRLLEPFLEEAIGAEIVVRNLTGAGSLVGVRAIRDAPPDGRTLGYLNGSGMLIQALQEDVSGLDLTEDFEVLGRLTAAKTVWVTGSGSRYHTLDDVLGAAADGPLLFGIVDAGSVGFVSSSVAALLLGIEVAYVPGYPGGREMTLGVMRGETDLAGSTFESILGRIEAGDLRPLLQISDRPIADHPSLRGVPVLGGEQGAAARRAVELGADPGEAVARTDALIRMFDVGRIAVAPRGVPQPLLGCLREGLAEAVGNPRFVELASRTERSFDYADADGVLASLATTAEARRALAPEIRNQIARLRAGR